MGIVVGAKAAFGARVPRRGIQVGPNPAAIFPCSRVRRAGSSEVNCN